MILPVEDVRPELTGSQERNIEEGGNAGASPNRGRERKILEQGTAMGMKNFGD